MKGVYPAAVTPFDSTGKVDFAGLAKLLAWFEAAGCQGAVLAGTNGEGPSLSATEKRELLERGAEIKGSLDLILGVATPSLEEAAWLCRRAADSGAAAALVMPPGYFREASEEGVTAWFEAILERSPVPILVYNFPQRTGITLTPAMIERLGRFPNMAGVKDSSGERENLRVYRDALSTEKSLFVGNETLLLEALESGWSGTISGAANSVPQWLVQIVEEWLAGDKESAGAKFRILLPVLEEIRKVPQPAGHKAVLTAFGILSSPDVRLPLQNCDPETRDRLLGVIERQTGFTPRHPV
jgi:4-hydroxy-tetrahydrodipicolinate synthase